MMKPFAFRLVLAAALSLFGAAWAVQAQEDGAANRESGGRSFDEASSNVQQQLEASLQELSSLRQQMADEKVPLSRKLSDLEAELVEVRLEYQKTTRLLDSRTLDLSNLRNEIKSRKDETAYLSNLLSEYIRNFESRLHIAEAQRYSNALEAAKLAPENTSLSDEQIFAEQSKLVAVSLDRLNEALSGARFKGQAVDPSGLVKPGRFVLIGPAALFQSDDKSVAGTAEQRLGSLEPTVIEFEDPALTAAVAGVVENGMGEIPLDPTLGNAHKIEATKESFIEHVQKGGPVMVPMFLLAFAALAVALYKWYTLAFIKPPTKPKMDRVLKAVRDGDTNEAMTGALDIGGPTGQMLAVGIEHIDEPRDLIEEVMYEVILSTKLRLQGMLPFIAISASSAPLLGLLGTVTGIINTFKLITVFGSGDVKSLSGGISEALITTKFGLIVAIPSLLLHAFLSRKARGVTDDMEKAAIAFINEVSKLPTKKEKKGKKALAEAK